MKRIEWKWLCGFLLLMWLTTTANAESPREQMKQMVEQLQTHSSDDALRERIIRLAQELKPAPAVSDEAIEFEGRAQFAFKNAKSNDDFLAAAGEYEKAVATAPWVANYYLDLCTIYEKASKLEDAKRNCEFALIGLVDAALITDIKRRIAGLKYGIEQNSPAAVAARGKNISEEFLKKLDGAKFVRRNHQEFRSNSWSDSTLIYEVRGNKIFEGFVITANDGSDEYSRASVGKMQWVGEYLINGHEFTIPRNEQYCQHTQSKCLDEIQSISDDGNKITEKRTVGGKLEEKIYLREK